MEQRYQVVFINEFDKDADVEAIKSALVTRFKLSVATVEALLAKETAIVKDNLDGEAAATYKMAIDATGANCRIEAMAVISGGKHIRERRRTLRRDEESVDRRKLKRAGSIQPDRRKALDRRKTYP